MFNFFNSVNKNQIALISLEFPPYAKASGMGDNNRDFAVCYKDLFRNNDIRVIMPFYNSPEFLSGAKETNICFKFQYGVRNGEAQVYKIENPKDNIPVYCIRSDTFLNIEKPYQHKDIKLFGFCSAFSNSAIVALEKISKNEKESFNPKVIHLTDWHTSLCGLRKARYFLNNKTIVHAIHNIGTGYQGDIFPFFALLLFYSRNEIEKILKYENFKTLILQLAKNNQEIISSCEVKKILCDIANNIDKIATANNFEIIAELNNIVVNIFPNKHYDSKCYFSALGEGICDCDSWIVDSPKYFEEITKYPQVYAPSLESIVNNNKNKGHGILIGTDSRLYNPNDSTKIHFGYNFENFENGKLKNKLFIQEKFSKSHNIDFTDKLVTDIQNAQIKGFLNVDKDAIMLFSASRFDINQKGIDTLLVLSKVILDVYPNVQFVFAGPDYIKNNSNVTEFFLREIMNSDLYNGRVLLIDSFIPMQQYLAAADFFLMPSRFEPGGTSQFQAMRYGCIPIVRNTGGLANVIVTAQENCKLSNGFKTQYSYFETDEPEKDYLNAVQNALYIYQNDKKGYSLLVKNAMNYDSTWENSAKLINDLYK